MAIKRSNNHRLASEPAYQDGYKSGHSTGRKQAGRKLVAREKILVDALKDISKIDIAGVNLLAIKHLNKWCKAGGKLEEKSGE